ncbi:peptidyl-tRNA hydrolase ArfB [Abditibacteriota bacterium]|nr:peptidyl-tRNA hydrolase ArfB [Abditibacteriota bacterium]
MIQITPHISLRPDEIHEEFVRSSGAGGQNVNKVSTAVQLRFDIANSPSLSDEVKERLLRLAGSRATGEGVLILKAQTQRTQERNREEALARLIELVQQAAIRPVMRRPTKPTRASQRRRLDEKRANSERKRLRSVRGE